MEIKKGDIKEMGTKTRRLGGSVCEKQRNGRRKVHQRRQRRAG